MKYQPLSSILIDNFGRFHNYLRMSLTEKCNLRCVYCMPKEGIQLNPRDNILTLNERMRIISIFAKLGTSKIRFTGGEPTISSQLLPLVRHASQCGIKFIGITTNGIQLGRFKYQLDDLINNGLTSINISLDTLIPSKFEEVTRRDAKNLNYVLSNIYYSTSKIDKLKTKINTVMIRGFNDNELISFIHLIRDIPVDIRFIELMPFDGNEWSPTKMISYKEVIDMIQKEDNIQIKEMKEVDKHDTTKWFQAIDLKNGIPHIGRVGFITSMTRYFI